MLGDTAEDVRGSDGALIPLSNLVTLTEIAERFDVVATTAGGNENTTISGQTALFGKWHLNYSPEGSGIQNWAVLDDQGKYYNPDIITPEGKKVVVGYATDITTDLTIDWLTKQRKADQPFVLMMHHKAPHRNFMPAIRHIQKYIGTEFPVPTNYFDHYDGRAAAASQEMTIARDMYEAISKAHLGGRGLMLFGKKGRKARPDGFRRRLGRRQIRHEHQGPLHASGHTRRAGLCLTAPNRPRRFP